MDQVKTLLLPGDIKVAYRTFPDVIDPAKPTLVLLHSFTLHGALYLDQQKDPELTAAVNLLAIDELGHGYTRGPEVFTFWDTAKMCLDVINDLAIRKCYVLGTSQGGFIAARMAILEPDRLNGIILLGTSMFPEVEETRELGCWDVRKVWKEWSHILISDKPTPDWVCPEKLTDDVLHVGLGETLKPETRSYWRKEHTFIYAHEEGRKRLLMATRCLFEREGLEHEIQKITVPVLVLHGTKDAVYSVACTKTWVSMFKNARDVKMEIIQDGQHFLSASHPKETDKFTLDFIKSH